MRPFRRDDAAEVNAWYRAHGQPIIPPSAFPQTGFISPGVAAGFLYGTDGGFALIEGYVSRPGCGPKKRHAALNEITNALVESAQEQGFTHVVAICRDTAIEKRAARHRFRPIGRYAVYAREM